jgi:predicted metal-binding protein
MSLAVATICRSCPAGQAGLADHLKVAFGAAGLALEVREIDCMSGCTRPSTLAFRAPGKTAYLFGDIDDTDLTDILVFARLYLESADGNLADARPLGALREKAIARIPG